MERDPRHDHSFSLPDPELARKLGDSSACARCHGDEGDAWAAEQILAWYGPNPEREARRALAGAFASARRRDRASVPALLACLAGETCRDEVRRASAARLLAPLADEPGATAALLRAAAPAEPSPLVRSASLWALAEQADPSREVLLTLAEGARDPARLARTNAAWGLRGIDAARLPRELGEPLRAAQQEALAALASQADHPEALYTRAAFLAAAGDADGAEADYRAALRLAPESVPARYNLAMLLVESGRVEEAERELVRVHAADPGFADASYALGAIYGETGRWREAVAALTDCLKSDPLHPGALTDLAHAYVELGQEELATRVVEAAAAYPGAEREARRAMVALSLRREDEGAARRWAREAVARGDAELAKDPDVARLLEQDGAEP
jgi:tetratricopeptide (TPR) repeat protein